MQQWFTSGLNEWWIDRSPPPEASYAGAPSIDEVECHFLADATQLVQRVVRNALDVSISRVLEEAAPPCALHRTSAVQREQQVASLIVAGRLRVWRRPLPMTGSTGAGGPSRISTLSSLRTQRRPEGRAYERPGRRSATTKPTSSSSTPGAPSAEPSESPGSSSSETPIIPPLMLFSYEFILVDELGEGVPDVAVTLTTPAGTQPLTTNGGGSVRVVNAPPGNGSAIVDNDSLVLALTDRAERPRRTSKPPDETADFQIVTPSRASATFTFPHDTPHTVMVISRTDIVVAGSDARWGALSMSAESNAPCRFTPGELDQLQLCSRGQGEQSLVEGETRPPATAPDSSAAAARASVTQGKYVVKPGDSLFQIAGKLFGNVMRWTEIRDANANLFKHRSPNLIHPGDVLNVPVVPAFGFFTSPGPFPPDDSPPTTAAINIDVDPLHEALFDSKGDRMFDAVAASLVQPPAAPEPFFDAPGPAADAAAVLASVVALEQGLGVDELFQPLDLPLFDPVERRGPPKK